MTDVRLVLSSITAQLRSTRCSVVLRMYWPIWVFARR